MARSVFIRISIAILLLCSAWNTHAQLKCSDLFYQSEYREWPETEPISDFSRGVTSFNSKPFQNGAFLLEFFGPMKNGIREWLKWLESETPIPPPPESPGLYHGHNSLIVAKEMKFPFDAGISQMDPSRKRFISLMEFPTDPDSRPYGSSPQAIATRKSLLKTLDMFIYGLYGAMKEDTYHNLVIRTTISGDHTLYASTEPNARYHTRASIMMYPGPDFKPPSNPIYDFDRVAKVVSETDKTVTIKVKLGSGEDGLPLNANEELIQRMFFITHWQMVQKAYRDSGLFKDDLETALYLLDDFIKTMEKSNGEQSLYLVYDKEAWQSMRFRMAVAHRYVAIDQWSVGQQPYYYQTIPDVFYPFYPRYGVALEKHSSGEYELKRLFHNSDPDPLHRLTRFTEPKGLNLEIHQAVARDLPEHAIIKVVSKTAAHTRLYKSVGFKLESSEFNPEWQTQKDILTQTREDFMEHTKGKDQ